MPEDLYPVVIIDDEALARVGMRSLVDWEAYGFYIAGDAADGGEAKRIISELQPALVFVDIRMPRTDGLEVIEETNGAAPNRLFVVVSAYNDFEYARQAMHLKAFDYVLKLELNRRRLAEILERAKTELDSTRVAGSSQASDGGPYSVSLLDVLEGRCSEQEALQRFPAWADARVFYVCITRVEPAVVNSHSDRTRHGTVELFMEILGDEASFETTRVEASVVATVFCESREHSERSRRTLLRQRLAKARAGLCSYFESRTTTLVSATVLQPDSLSAAYGRVSHAFFDSLVCRSDELVFLDGYQSLMGSLTDYPGGLFVPIQQAAVARDLEAFQGAIDRILESLGAITCAYREFLLELCSYVSHAINSAAPRSRLTETVGSVWSSGEPYSRLSTINTLEGFELWLRTTRDSVAPQAFEQLYHPLVKSAMQLVRSRYAEDLTLEDTAEFLETSPSYLSRLFRREANNTFNEFLTAVRLAAGERLLTETDFPVQTIARKVGYENGYYFSRVFNRKTGMTPSDFRRTKKSM